MAFKRYFRRTTNLEKEIICIYTSFYLNGNCSFVFYKITKKILLINGESCSSNLS